MRRCFSIVPLSPGCTLQPAHRKPFPAAFSAQSLSLLSQQLSGWLCPTVSSKESSAPLCPLMYHGCLISRDHLQGPQTALATYTHAKAARRKGNELQQTARNHPVAWGWYFSLSITGHQETKGFFTHTHQAAAQNSILHHGLEHYSRKAQEKPSMSDNPHHCLFSDTATVSTLDHFLLNECPPFTTGFETLLEICHLGVNSCLHTQLPQLFCLHETL